MNMHELARDILRATGLTDIAEPERIERAVEDAFRRRPHDEQTAGLWFLYYFAGHSRVETKTVRKTVDRESIRLAILAGVDGKADPREWRVDLPDPSVECAWTALGFYGFFAKSFLPGGKKYVQAEVARRQEFTP